MLNRLQTFRLTLLIKVVNQVNSETDKLLNSTLSNLFPLKILLNFSPGQQNFLIYLHEFVA